MGGDPWTEIAFLLGIPVLLGAFVFAAVFILASLGVWF